MDFIFLPPSLIPLTISRGETFPRIYRILIGKIVLLKNSRCAKLEENVNFEAKESSSRCVGERRFIMDRVRSSHPFGSQREVAGQREVRRVRDVQNNEGRIQGAGGGGRGENRASKSRCIMRRGNKHRGARSLFQLVDVSAVRSTCTSAADAAVFRCDRVQIETATAGPRVFSPRPKGHSLLHAKI